MGLIERADPDGITVQVYHRCLSSATGSAMGPGGEVAYWWIAGGFATPRIVAASGLLLHGPDRERLEDAIRVAVGLLPAARVAEAQDAAAEALD